MSKSKAKKREKLRAAARRLIQENENIERGKPIGEQHLLAKKLEQSCPGFEYQIYLDTISRAIWNNR